MPAARIEYSSSTERVGLVGGSAEPGRSKHRPGLAAAVQCGLETRPAVALAAGDVAVLGHQVPVLGGAECADAGLLRLRPRPLWPCSVVDTR
jgi:hypothetical protein